MTESKQTHEFIRWNSEQQQWFCIRCGRTSDHHAARDARIELDQYSCGQAASAREKPSTECSQ
jgi:hypothetical protein